MTGQRVARIGVVVGVLAAAVFTVLIVRSRPRAVDRGVVPVTGLPTTPVARSPVAQPVRPGFVPARVSIDRLAVAATVVPVLVDAAGALAVPADPGTLGWWAGGALPGSATGTVVVDGHVDDAATGPGALFDLRRIRVGDLVALTGTGPGAVTYRVTGLREYHKADLPAAQVFSTGGAPRLAVITCGGPFDARTRHYRDNLVAYAVPVAHPPPG